MNKMKGLQKLLRQIPRGKITSYKILARKLDLHPRVIGRMLSNNDSDAPCYKVVNHNGKIGGYSGKGGIKSKIKKLKYDGIIVKNRKIINFEKCFYYFP